MKKTFKKVLAIFLAAITLITASAITTISFAEEATPCDFNVWVNGKDTKANTAKNIVASYYKTATKQHTGYYMGGKWTVLVTPSDVDTVSEFIALFDADKKTALTDTGKTAAANAKKIATAKIKDGLITVTAGKEAGLANVWVYEVNNKTIVNDTSVEGKEIEPKCYTICTKTAASSIVLTTTAANLGTGKILVDKARSESKIICTLNNGAESQTATVVYIGDKKIDATASTYTVANSDATIATAVYSAEAGTITVTPVKDGKTTVTVTNTQSGKTAKLAVTVAASYKVSVPENVTIKYKENGADVEKTNGDFYVPDRTAVTVTYTDAIASVKVGDVVIAGGKTFKIAGKDVVITATEKVTLTAVNVALAKIAKDGKLAEATTTDTEKYTIATTWKKDGTAAASGATVAAGEYVATVTLTAKTGYEFGTVTAPTSSDYTVAAGAAAKDKVIFTYTITVA